MKERIVGILGGMGPGATADLLLEITRLTPATRDQDHVQILIYSNPRIPDRTAAILGGGEDPVPPLVESARRLEAAGAGVIAIPCNTAHYFLPAIREAVRIPVLDMIEETFDEFRRILPRVSAAGLLAATGTVRSGIYARTFEARGVRLIVPAPAEQDSVHACIQRVKAGERDPAIQTTFESCGLRLVERGAEAVILGCTEIPLAFDPERVSYAAVNATRALAAAALRWAKAGHE